MRHDGRAATDLRRVELQPGFTTNPAGSVLMRAGRTMVLCTACIEEGVPRHRLGKGGWLTAEYAMAPGATHTRGQRESMKGRVQGRTYEIQRLIGRSLRAAVNLEALPEVTIHLDHEVLQADGGTRTASITGGWVALALAVDRLVRDGRIGVSPITEQIAAISCGVVNGTSVVDLDYVEDSSADVDANLVMTSAGEWVELQATGEGGTLRRDQLDTMLSVGETAIRNLFVLQRLALGDDVVTRLGLRGLP